jgi:hypothetical protein
MSQQSLSVSDLIVSINRGVLGKHRDSYDILTMAALSAAIDSAAYYQERMLTARNFSVDFELLEDAMRACSIKGSILEFGVASGRTINHIASLTNQTVYGFDSFEGLPETWRTGFEKGVFVRQAPPQVGQNVQLLVGYFEDTLNGFLNMNNEEISLLHVDCDLYSSTKTIFEKLSARIVPGTVIVFDEYFNYPGYKNHEFKAFQEFCLSESVRYRYHSFVSRHQQVCVIIDSKGKA